MHCAKMDTNNPTMDMYYTKYRIAYFYNFPFRLLNMIKSDVLYIWGLVYLLCERKEKKENK